MANADTVEIDGINYILYSSTQTAGVTSKSGAKYSGVVVIPSSVSYHGNNYSVTSIEYCAFYRCSGLTSVTIPNSVTSIGWGAFEGTSWYNNQPDGVVYAGKNVYKYKGTMPNNTSIVIDEGTYSISPLAFQNCSGLTSITIPNSVTTIGGGAFSGCSGLTSITIPNSVTSIGNSAFQYCTSLTSVTIPNSVTSIGYGAFAYCSALTLITIPNSVTSIGYAMFRGCSNLSSITIPDSVTSIEQSAFEECTGLISITIPKSVTSIKTSTFKGCSNLSSITIPDSVTSIGESAFEECYSLSSITIPNTVTNIGASVFKGCSSLTAITIPDNVTTIGDDTFYGCSNLTSIAIGKSVSSIEKSAFYVCSKIIRVELNCNNIVSKDYNKYNNIGNIFGKQVKEYVLGNSVKRIGNYAFYGCSDITSITIPNSVSGIRDGAFDGCSALATVHITDIAAWCNIQCNSNPFSNNLNHHLFLNGEEITDLIIPNNNIRVIRKGAFINCTSITSVTIPQSVLSIEQNAFYGCSNIVRVELDCNFIVSKEYIYYDNIGILFGGHVEKCVLGNSVTSIGDSAFYGCSSLTSITIPNSVTSIGGCAFVGCSGLTSITIPNSVTSIGGGAFNSCSSLTSITIPNSVTSIEKSTFAGCSSLTSITIPNSVTSIGDGAFRGCSNLTDVHIPDIEAWCNLQCNSYPFDNDKVHHLYLNDEEITDLVIPHTIDEIRPGAFKNCTGLISVTIPNNVTTIGEEAFDGCSSITKVELDCNKVVSKEYNFNYNFSTIFGGQVKEYVLGSNVKSIGEQAFYNCSGMTSVNIPNSVTNIGLLAFGNCSSLTSITIPNSVTSIGDGAFFGCSNIIRVEIDCNYIVSKENNEYNYYNDNLGAIFGNQVKEYVLGNSIESIGSWKFYYCRRLTSVNIPKSVTRIGVRVFANCYDLASMVVDEDNPIYDSRENCNAIVKTASNTLMYGCKNTDIPSSVTSIGEYAFYGCEFTDQKSTRLNSSHL